MQKRIGLSAKIDLLQSGKTLTANNYILQQPPQQQQSINENLQSPQPQLHLKTTIQQNRVLSTTNLLGTNSFHTILPKSSTLISATAEVLQEVEAVKNLNLPLISKQLYNKNGDNIKQNKLHFIDYDEI